MDGRHRHHPLTQLGTIAPTVAIHDTIRADGTFSGTLWIANLGLLPNPVAGPVHVRTGTWSAPGDSILVLTSVACSTSDTASFMGIPGLPFHQTSDGEFVANALLAAACGAPDTVRTRPGSDGHWSVPMSVNLRGISTGRWILDFARQP